MDRILEALDEIRRDRFWGEFCAGMMETPMGGVYFVGLIYYIIIMIR